jgi:hypothetical protein
MVWKEHYLLIGSEIYLITLHACETDELTMDCIAGDLVWHALRYCRPDAHLAHCGLENGLER